MGMEHGERRSEFMEREAVVGGEACGTNEGLSFGNCDVAPCSPVSCPTLL